MTGMVIEVKSWNGEYEREWCMVSGDRKGMSQFEELHLGTKRQTTGVWSAKQRYRKRLTRCRERGDFAESAHRERP